MTKKSSPDDNSSKKKKYERVTFTWEGKRYERTGRTIPEAHAKAATLKEQLKRGELGVSGNMTLTRWADEWLETYKRPSVGEKQYQMYKAYIKNLIKPAIGGRPIRDIKDVDLQKILNSRQGKSLSDVTKVLYVIKSIFRQAHASRLIQYNPAEYLIPPAAHDDVRRSITDAERKAILAVSETHYAGLWIKIMLYCGLRPQETRALDWRHVDLEKKLIHIESAMKAGTSEIGRPKSAAGVRDIPIPNHFLPELAVAKRGSFEPVFTTPQSSRRWTEDRMRKMWKSFKRDLDIYMGAKLKRNKIIFSVVAPDLVPYCLRHTYCTDLQDKGVSINLARYLMGHADISTTARVYTHTTEKAIQNAADIINGVVSNVVESQKEG